MAHAGLPTRTFMRAAVITCAGSTATAETASDRQAGKVHFPISCSADAQQPFDRALAVLHSFWYEGAAKQVTAGAPAATPPPPWARRVARHAVGPLCAAPA